MNAKIKNIPINISAKPLNDLKKQGIYPTARYPLKSGLSAPYIFELAKGRLLPPKDENLQKIAEAMGVAPEYFKEYRQRRLTEKLDTVNLSKEDYNTPLSDEEVAYLKKIIDKHLNEE